MRNLLIIMLEGTGDQLFLSLYTSDLNCIRLLIYTSQSLMIWKMDSSHFPQSHKLVDMMLNRYKYSKAFTSSEALYWSNVKNQ